MWRWSKLIRHRWPLTSTDHGTISCTSGPDIMHRDDSAWAQEACVKAGRALAAFLRPFFEQRWLCCHRRRRGHRCSRTMEGSENLDLRTRYDRTSIYTNMKINWAHILMMRGWCFEIGCTVPRPRSIWQIIGWSHRCLAIDARNICRSLPTFHFCWWLQLSNTLPSKNVSFQKPLLWVLCCYRSPFLSNPSSKPPTIMLFFIFQNKS